MLRGDQAANLLGSLDGRRVALEVALKRIEREPHGFGDGICVGCLPGGVFQPGEFGEELKDALRGVASVHGEGGSVAVRLKLLFLAVAGEEEFYGQASERADGAQIAKMGLDLGAVGAVAKINMFDLVAENRGKCVFRVHEREETLTDEDVSAWKRKGVDEVRIRYVVNPPGQVAAGVRGRAVGDGLQIVLEGERRGLRGTFCGKRGREIDGVVGGELVAKGDLVGVGHAVDVRGDAREFVLGVGCGGEDGLRVGAGVDAVALHRDDGEEAGKQDHGEGKPAFHRVLGLKGVSESSRDSGSRGTKPRAEQHRER